MSVSSSPRTVWYCCSANVTLMSGNSQSTTIFGLSRSIFGHMFIFSLRVAQIGWTTHCIPPSSPAVGMAARSAAT